MDYPHLPLPTRGWSPAYSAAISGHLPCLQLLAERRADLDAKDYYGSGLGEGKMGRRGEGQLRCSGIWIHRGDSVDRDIAQRTF